MISAQVIADSINPTGNRLTSFVLEYPRFVHSEFLTHRMFSKNSASSRAIPIEKMIQAIVDNPAMPVFWGKNQSGMQANEELDDVNATYRQEFDLHLTDKEYAKALWEDAKISAISHVRELNRLGLHKQIANRILEPWFNIKVICSATEYGNFFALRAHKDAQPEIRVLAETMLEAYNNSKPKYLQAGDWHIPFGDKMHDPKIWTIIYEKLGRDRFELGATQPVLQPEFSKEYWDIKIKIAVARCARVSYLNYEGKDDYEADIKLCDRLFSSVPRHLSPTEHVAQALPNSQMIGNYKGWKQYRKFFSEENLQDPRIK